MRGFLAALIEAIARALRWIWSAVDGAWKLVRAPFSPPPLGAREDVNEPAEVSFEERLAAWARDRSMGRDVRLPTGISPAIGGWAARLNRVELERVAAAGTVRIREHLAGRTVIVGVRPAVVTGDQDKAARLAAIRSRGAGLRAAVARSQAAYEARQDRERGFSPAM